MNRDEQKVSNTQQENKIWSSIPLCQKGPRTKGITSNGFMIYKIEQMFWTKTAVLSTGREPPYLFEKIGSPF